MDNDVCYKILDQRVAHEIIDGEAILIHFDTGNYYSLTGVSAQIWKWFTEGASRGQILGAFEPLTPGQTQELDEFVGSLVREGIIEKETGTAGSRAPLPERQVAFEQPKFAKYNDMQNLLLSDPIHDVDESGWPNLPQNV